MFPVPGIIIRGLGANLADIFGYDALRVSFSCLIFCATWVVQAQDYCLFYRFAVISFNTKFQEFMVSKLGIFMFLSLQFFISLTLSGMFFICTSSTEVRNEWWTFNEHVRENIRVPLAFRSVPTAWRIDKYSTIVVDLLKNLHVRTTETGFGQTGRKPCSAEFGKNEKLVQKNTFFARLAFTRRVELITKTIPFWFLHLINKLNDCAYSNFYGTPYIE